MMHKFSVEKLYHFRCCVCNLWWSIADYHTLKQEYISCPHCGSREEYEEIENGTEPSTPTTTL